MLLAADAQGALGEQYTARLLNVCCVATTAYNDWCLRRFGFAGISSATFCSSSPPAAANRRVYHGLRDAHLRMRTFYSFDAFVTMAWVMRHAGALRFNAVARYRWHLCTRLRLQAFAVRRVSAAPCCAGAGIFRLRWQRDLQSCAAER